MKNTDFQGWFLGLMKDTLVSNRQFFYKVADQSDRIIVWLVGFSITSIALSINKGDELDKFIVGLTDYILICGSLTVIFGVLYRIFLYLAQAYEMRILIGFEGYINGYNNPPDIPYGRELTDEDTYEDIIDYLKSDFDVEIQKLDTTKIDSFQLDILRNDLANYYLSLNNLSNQKLEMEIDGIKKVLSKHLGYSDKRIDRMFSDKQVRFKLTSVYWFCIYASSILFILSCLSFTVGMFIIMFSYVQSI